MSDLPIVEEALLMFGLSRDERRRLEKAEEAAEKAEEAADKARDVGGAAIAALQAHAAACKVLQEDTSRRLGNIEDQNKWQSRGIVVILLMMLGAILAGIAEHKGIF